MDFSQIFTISWQFLAVVAVAFVIMCLLASHIRFQNLARQAAAADAGMDPQDAFQLAIAHTLGTVHATPDPFCVLFVAIHDLSAMEQRCGAGSRTDLLESFEARIRASLRSSDKVVALSGDRIGVLLNAPYENAEAVCRRLVRQVAETPFRCASGVVVPLAACVGGAAHPEHGERVTELLDRAGTSFEQALAEGPGTAVMAEHPAERAVEQEPSVSPAARGLIDPLTGLLRPDKVGPAVQKFVSRYRRQEKPVSLLLLDVDHLHRYNEHYGMEAGDTLLRKLGELMQTSFREEDLVTRLGGEEFLIVMGCSPESALIAGQRVLGFVKRTAMVVQGGTLRITLSGGIAGYPDHGGHPKLLLEHADAALAAAKERGRNMCVIYDSSMRARPPAAQPTDTF